MNENNDKLVAKAGKYSVTIHIEGQSGIALLAEGNDNGDADVIASTEDIVPQIEKLVPQKEALELATQLARAEITREGGVEKYQALINANVKKHTENFYNYLTPLSIAAYKANGVIMPVCK